MTPDTVWRSELPSLFGIIQSEVTKFCASLIALQQSTATLRLRSTTRFKFYLRAKSGHNKQHTFVSACTKDDCKRHRVTEWKFGVECCNQIGILSAGLHTLNGHQPSHVAVMNAHNKVKIIAEAGTRHPP